MEDKMTNLEHLLQEVTKLNKQVYLLLKTEPVELRPGSDKIRVNVGGKRFETLSSTLLMEKDTFFHHMLSRKFKSEEEGEYFIDRDPKWFQAILNFLRKKKVEISHL